MCLSASINEAAAQFLAADSSVFALIGPSGVGKSTEIAALAQRLSGRALLLRGSALRPDSASLAEAIERTLSSAARGLPLPQILDMAVSECFA